MGVRLYDRLNRDKQTIKRAVKEHWEAEPCESREGKTLSDRKTFFQEIDSYRYEKSPFIPDFAKFEESNGKRVLEIGLGSGSDFVRWVKSGACAVGRDLTRASVNLVLERLALEKLEADVQIGDVETLEFGDESFDIVYSYGVIHHTPDTLRAVREIHRVLRKGGVAKVMIYHARGLTFFYQWVLFGLLQGKPGRSPREIAFFHNESIGTKLYTVKEARELLGCFTSVRIQTVVDAGDTLNFGLSDRYKKVLLIRAGMQLFRFLKYLRPLLPSYLGTTMLIEARK